MIGLITVDKSTLLTRHPAVDARDLLAWNMRRLRVERGLSQELAFDSGIDRTYVSRLERRIENPSIAIVKLALTLGVPIAADVRRARKGRPGTAAAESGPQAEGLIATTRSADRSSSKGPPDPTGREPHESV